MADKFIKVQDAKDEFYYTLADKDCAITDYKHAYEILDGVEVADVAPVVHGKWIEEPVTENNSMVKCSACGEYPEKKDQCFTPYCCLCGAKMDL